MKSVRHITRNEPHKGWHVRVRHANVSKFFSDNSFGGKRASFAAAKEYYEGLGVPERLRKWRWYASPTVRNKTGTSGVCRVVRSVKVADGTIREWATYHASVYVAPYTKEEKTFSVQKYGEEEALKKAVAFRKKWTKKIGKRKEKA